MEKELSVLKAHVVKCWEAHRNDMRQKTPMRTKLMSPSKLKVSESFTDQPIEARQDILRKNSREFASFPVVESLFMSSDDIALIRASCAYVYDYEKKKYGPPPSFTRFPWDVAMRELCTIKAKATGRHKTVSGDFYDHFNIKHPKKHHH